MGQRKAIRDELAARQALPLGPIYLKLVSSDHGRSEYREK